MTGDSFTAENALPFRFESRLLDSIGEAVIATDLEGKVIYWNKFAEKLYGYASDEAVGRSIYELTVPSLSENLGREIVNAVRSGENWHGEFDVRRKDGSTFVAEVTDVRSVARTGNSRR